MELNNIANMSRQELMASISDRKSEIERKLKNGETEKKFATGAASFTLKEWDQLMAKVDKNIEQIKEEQEQRKEELQKEELLKDLQKQQEIYSAEISSTKSVRRNFIYEKLTGTYKKQYPYEHLAQDGVINYQGTIFVCDAEKNAICLGDMSDRKNVLTIPLEDGGSLMVNRNDLGDLSNAITMFTPADQNRIMRAIADDKKAQEMQREIEDDKNSIGNDADSKTLDRYREGA